jgi:ribonuclease-3
VGVMLANSKFYTADGSSKKEAEQNAAIICLKNNKLS